MEKVKFYDLPTKLKFGKLEFDGDKKDKRLHSEEIVYWGASTKKQYNAACKGIDKIEYKGEGWKIYAWYDVSSYEYWMKNMKEQNYIQISVSFDSDTISKDEVSKLDYALDCALADADAIAYKYNFNPYLD
jgi:hypothetical protein